MDQIEQTRHVDRRAAAILHFWFGEERATQAVCAEKSPLWGSKNEQTDAEIRRRFAAVTEQVANGGLTAWRDSAPGLLAAIISQDQFPRDMHRGQAAAFAHDPVARALARLALERGMDAALSPVRRVFVYMPFEHSEALADQELCVSLFAAMRAAADSDHEIFDNWLDFAERHRRIIREFGRFPHRNAILGRASTARETAFLKEPGAAF